MTSPEQPLPDATEVLICSEKTKVDQVELFMRRAMCKPPCDGNFRIFLLTSAEQLHFNVAKKVDDMFNIISQKQQCSDDYVLVILMNLNQHHYISSCFEKVISQ